MFRRPTGGAGADFLYSVIVVEEMTRTNHCGLSARLHSNVVVPYITAFATEEQKQRCLPRCVSGDCITAIAMSEPQAGSDLSAIRTTATEEGDAFNLNGQKTFISNAINGDLFVVAARDPAVENPHAAIDLYLVEADTPGLSKGIGCARSAGAVRTQRSSSSRIAGFPRPTAWARRGRVSKNSCGTCSRSG